MTYQQKYKENKKFLQLYVDFLPECTTYDERLKLSTEIGRLNEQNKQIEKMEFADTKKDISDYTIEVNAYYENKTETKTEARRDPSRAALPGRVPGDAFQRRAQPKKHFSASVFEGG